MSMFFVLIFEQGLLNTLNLLREIQFCSNFKKEWGGEEAINWGLSGPMLRASGIQWDPRIFYHYECYDDGKSNGKKKEIH